MSIAPTSRGPSHQPPRPPRPRQRRRRPCCPARRGTASRTTPARKSRPSVCCRTRPDPRGGGGGVSHVRGREGVGREGGTHDGIRVPVFASPVDRLCRDDVAPVDPRRAASDDEDAEDERVGEEGQAEELAEEGAAFWGEGGGERGGGRGGGERGGEGVVGRERRGGGEGPALEGRGRAAEAVDDGGGGGGCWTSSSRTSGRAQGGLGEFCECRRAGRGGGRRAPGEGGGRERVRRRRLRKGQPGEGRSDGRGDERRAGGAGRKGQREQTRERQPSAQRRSRRAASAGCGPGWLAGKGDGADDRPVELPLLRREGRTRAMAEARYMVSLDRAGGA